MARKVTLYIEDNDIKLLVTKGMQVEKWASLLLEPTLVSDGVIVDEDQVASAIKVLYELQGVKQKKVIVALSGLNSIFRIISMPELPPALLPEAVKNEAGRAIPVPLDQVYLSYQQIPSPKGETRLFLVAYPRNSTDTLVRTLKSAGLKPSIMELAPLALCRSNSAPRAIIVNAWLTYLDIVIMEDRLPQVIRSLSLPTDAPSMKERLPYIAEELNRTIAFYNSSNPEHVLDASVPLFVCGDLAEAPDSWKSIVGKLGFSVSVLASPMAFPEAFTPFKFMVNAGLALKEKSFTKKSEYSSIIDLNALPEIYRPKAINLTKVLAPVAVVAGIGALAYGGLLVQDIGDQASKLHSQADSASLEVTELRLEVGSINAAAADKSNEIDLMPEQITAVESELESVQVTEAAFNAQLTTISQGLTKANGDLRQVVDLQPADITLLDIKYDGILVNVSGISPDESDIFIYARALRSSGRFPNVIVSSIAEIIKIEGEEEIRLFEFNLLLR
jgi:type IV pilus assembly protein PilM